MEKMYNAMKTIKKKKNELLWSQCLHNNKKTKPRQYVYICAGAYGGLKGTSDPLVLETQAVVSYSMWILEKKCRVFLQV